MTLQSQMATDMAMMLSTSDFAENVTYTVHETGATGTLPAIITVTADLAATPQGKGITGTATIAASAVARPAVYDTLTTSSGQVWRVELITGGDGFAWDLFITSDNKPVVS